MNSRRNCDGRSLVALLPFDLPSTGRTVKAPSDTDVRIWFLQPGTLRFFRDAANFYLGVLDSERNLLSTDEDLKSILPEGFRSTVEIELEAGFVGRIASWCEKKLEADAPVSVTKSVFELRMFRALGELYLKRLSAQSVRAFSRRPVSNHLRSAVEAQLSYYSELVTGGVFQGIDPMGLASGPIACSQMPNPDPSADSSVVVREVSTEAAATSVAIGIELLDEQLRDRCHDLFRNFTNTEQYERLDTVIAEATKILEDRIRIRCGAPAGAFGKQLYEFAFNGETPRIRLSEIKAEQAAALSLFCGVSGFIRNSAHHRLLGDLEPVRVMQILGFIDFCLAEISGSTVLSTSGEKEAGA